MQKSWHAIYVRSRTEKKVESLLSDNNIITYVPVVKTMRQWSDRKKLVYEPLFNSYVFVHLNDKELMTILPTSGVVNFVYWLGRPAVIRDEEIDTIKLFTTGERSTLCALYLESCALTYTGHFSW